MAAPAAEAPPLDVMMLLLSADTGGGLLVLLADGDDAAADGGLSTIHATSIPPPPDTHSSIRSTRCTHSPARPLLINTDARTCSVVLDDVGIRRVRLLRLLSFADVGRGLEGLVE